MKQKRISSFIFILVLYAFAYGQNKDTVFFTEQSFLKQVLDYAPAVSNAQLYVNLEQLQYQEARAAFEPKIGANYDFKRFEGKTYYDKLESGIKINTPIGVKVNGGYMNNSGIYLNPENNLPVQGLAYAGIEIPLGAGLFTDEARFNVKRQKLEMDAANLLYTLQANQYMFDAAQVYWEWYGNLLNLNLAQEAVDRVQNRYDFVMSRYLIGESAALDTLEAYINLQNRSAYLLDVQVKWFKSNAYLRNFIWLPEFDNQTIATTVDLGYRSQFPDTAQTEDLVYNHPIIQLIENDSLINNANIRLMREYFKPQVDLAFKFQQDAADVGSFNYSFDQNRYVGLNMYMPLFLRKERAKANQLETKQQMLVNKKSETFVKIKNDLDIALNNTQTLARSVSLWQNITENYEQLLIAEQTKFNLGESSLFILNNRELRWIDSREKYIKDYVQYRVQALQYYYTLGLLPSVIE